MTSLVPAEIQDPIDLPRTDSISNQKLLHIDIMAQSQFVPSSADLEDYENASRGLIDEMQPCIIKAPNGDVLWDNDAYGFLKDDCPITADPKLWRQGQLTQKQGLFSVGDSIYQVRGFDLSNMTLIEGKSGVIVIDPLISNECAEAALGLYRKHRGHRRVTGLIYSHSHVDHFGGAQGVLSDNSSGNVPIFAPEGFMEEVTSENVVAGPAMRRRAALMYGVYLPKGPRGQIGCGLGMTSSKGTNSLIPSTISVKATGEEHTIDDVQIVFQMVPETEAPAEINFYLPQHRALYISECATHCMHNITTLRGAQVRDAKAWAHYLDETIVLYGKRSDVLFAGHHWPTWGSKEIVQLISEQRDMYAYMHDQTVRLMNIGLNGVEIAETLKLPPNLQQKWHTQGYYGSLNHNVKGIYQRYMSWFDGNSAHLWPYPPAEEGRRYVACMGGIDETIEAATTYARQDDLRFAATLLSHVVSAYPAHHDGRLALASVYEKLGFGAENATWRNFYLTAALNLRTNKNPDKPLTTLNTMNPNASIEQWVTSLSVQINGPLAAQADFVIDLSILDTAENWSLIMSNGALTCRHGGLSNTEPEKVTGFESTSTADLTITLTKSELLRILQAPGDAHFDAANAKGDVKLMEQLLSLTK